MPFLYSMNEKIAVAILVGVCLLGCILGVLIFTSVNKPVPTEQIVVNAWYTERNHENPFEETTRVYVLDYKDKYVQYCFRSGGTRFSSNEDWFIYCYTKE